MKITDLVLPASVSTLLKVHLREFTQCIWVDSSTVICWTSPFVILGEMLLLLFCHFYSNFDGKPC